MSIESEADWTGLRRVGRIVRLALDAMERRVRPGVTTAELDRVAEEVLREHGARSAPRLVYGFPASVCISVNEEAVHGVPGPRVLRPGDAVTLDVTAEAGGYMADSARTVLVGEASPEVRRLAACARAAFAAAMTAARAGRPVREIGRAVEREARRQGFSVMPELGGHGIGRGIHEPPTVPNFGDPRQQDVLTEGLVIAVEPILCAGGGGYREDPDGWTLRTADGSVAVHHEHTVVVTRGRPVLLTAA
jgi:methionyl aminopeptidase